MSDMLEIVKASKFEGSPRELAWNLKGSNLIIGMIGLIMVNW